MVIERPASRCRTGIGALFAREETQARPTPIQPARSSAQRPGGVNRARQLLPAAIGRTIGRARAGRSGACVCIGLRGHPGRGPGRVAKPKDRRRAQTV